MAAVTAIAELLLGLLKITEKYIDDPKRRADARIEFKQEMLKRVNAICKEINTDESEKMLNEFVSIIYTL